LNTQPDSDVRGLQKCLGHRRLGKAAIV